MGPAFAEFGALSNFSFLRGASHPEELVAMAEALGYAGLGLADRNSVAGVVRAHSYVKERLPADTPFRFVTGVRLVFADGTPDILAYPKDRAAYGRLTRLLTTGNLRARKGSCILFAGDLPPVAAGLQLIVLEASSHEGPLVAPSTGHVVEMAGLARPCPLPALGHLPGGEKGFDEGASNVVPFKAISPRKVPSPRRGEGPQSGDEGFWGVPWLLDTLTKAGANIWLGATVTYGPRARETFGRRAALAKTTGVPLLATNDVTMHSPARRQLADIVTCIREGVTLDEAGLRLAAHAERHLKAPSEMARLFAGLPGALAETVRFLEGIAFALTDLRYDYPLELRAGYASEQEALTAFAATGAAWRYPAGVPPKVRAALDHELKAVEDLDYAAYFLTVHDIVRHARTLKILCQGRGSAANSALCYCLGITEVDPTKHDLLFERFISASRNEPPDIDVDFEHERREEVMQYIYDHYGRLHAGLTAAVVTYRTRSTIREVGKAFGLSDDMVGALSGTVWGYWSNGIDPNEARRIGIDPAEPRMAAVMHLAEELAGFPRHLSQHTGGFVITRSRLDEVVPIAHAAMPDRTTVEWDKDDLDALNILKIDILALGMLSCMRRGFDLLERHYGHRPTLATLPPEEACVYAMIQRATRSASSRSRAGRRCPCCPASVQRRSTTSLSRSPSCGPVPSRATWSIPTCAGGRGWSPWPIRRRNWRRCSARRWACRCSRSRR